MSAGIGMDIENKACERIAAIERYSSEWPFKQTTRPVKGLVDGLCIAVEQYAELFADQFGYPQVDSVISAVDLAAFPEIEQNFIFMPGPDHYMEMVLQ